MAEKEIKYAEETCETCRWGRYDNTLEIGSRECRRRAPKMYRAPQGLVTMFPIVPADFDCGEHRPKTRKQLEAEKPRAAEGKKPGITIDMNAELNIGQKEAGHETPIDNE